MKQYCAVLAPTGTAENIEQYRGIIHPLRPGLATASTSLPRFGITLTPWSNWQQTRTPDWWADHNRVKHQRSEHFRSAHLKNVLNAVSALFLLLIMYYREQADLLRLVPAPALFVSTPDLVKRAHALDGETGLYFQRLIPANHRMQATAGREVASSAMGVRPPRLMRSVRATKRSR